MRNLVIVESPSKSKTIQKYLGDDFEVVSSKGHIRDLSTSGKGGLGVDVDNGFKPTYKINKDKGDTVKQLKTKVKKAKMVYLATDPDREGEAISWHLQDELGLSNDKAQRVVFNEITKPAILEAFEHPRDVDMNLVRSQETRRILDRIIGFKLSKLLQSKISSKSAGRVQSVALRLIVEKEKEILAFVPEEKWTIKAYFDKNKTEFDAELEKFEGKTLKVKNQAENDKILSELNNEFIVQSIVEKQGAKAHKFPFITSTLQQEAANKLNFPAKKTMRIAQKLYEGVDMKDGQEGLITYMRTDSTRFSDGFVKDAQNFIRSEYGQDYVGFYKVKENNNAQDAHEAIRMTHIEYTPEHLKDVLTQDELKLYSLIYARSLASLMSSPKTKTISVTLAQKGYEFVAKGSKLEFDGYLKVYGKYETSKDKWLPHLDQDETLISLKNEGTQSFSNPPLRYSEARLIEALESKGIGRPSTYAMIIDTIIERLYVTLEKGESSKTRVFIPTEQGFLTDSKLKEHFESIINVDYTAQMESELDHIAEGNQDHVEALTRFYNLFTPLLTQAYDTMEKIAPVEVGRDCPDCGSPLVQRKGRFGPFIACSTYPTCKHIEKIEKEKEEPAFTGEMCPNCGSPLVTRKGRFGPFVACSNYPTCKTIINSKSKPQEAKETGEMCPDCGKPLVEKMSRYGKPFVGCSNYPKCRYIQKKAKTEEDEA
jgi:DNA topoisomerase-1